MITISGCSLRERSSAARPSPASPIDVVAELGEHLAQVEPDQRLVIGDQHAPRAGGAWGLAHGRGPQRLRSARRPRDHGLSTAMDPPRGNRTTRRIGHGLHGPAEGKGSGREDSNLRPPVPHTGALPDCATPRLVRQCSTSLLALGYRLSAFWRTVDWNGAGTPATSQ